MTDDLADAKRDDAADLLEVVKRNRSRAHKLLRPGYPEFLLLLMSQSIGRLADFNHEDGLAKVVIVIAIVMYPGHVTVTARQRRNLGVPVGLPTWLVAAGLTVASFVIAVRVNGEAKGDALAVAMAIAISLVAVFKRGVLLLMLGGALLIGAATQSTSNWIQIPLVLVWVAIVAFVGRKELFNR